MPAAVWALTVLFTSLLALHSFVSPLGSPTDEHTHLDLVLDRAEGGRYPGHDERMVSQGAMTAMLTFRPLMIELTPETAGGEVLERSYARWGGDRPSARLAENQMTQHPPLYYETVGTGLRAVRFVGDGPTSLYREWHLLRFFSVALLAPLPLLAWWCARTLGAPGPAQLGAPVALFGVPQLFHIGSSVNNDVLLTALGAGIAVLLARVLRGDDRRRVHVLIGCLTGLALLTKAFAVVFPLWVAIVYGMRAWRHRDGRRALGWGLVLAGGVTAAIAAWWWLRNLIAHGTPVPTSESDLYTSDMRPPGFEPDAVWYLQRFGAWIFRRFFGWFGWFEVPLTSGLVVGASVLFGLAFVLAFTRTAPPSTGGVAVSRTDLLALTSVLPLLVVFVFARAADLYLTTGQTPFIQGRYLFSALVPIVVVVGIGTNRLFHRWGPLVLLAGATVMQVDAFRLMLGSWWGEPDASVRRSIDSMLAWNPWPISLPVIAAVTIVVASGITTWSLLAAARSAPPSVRPRS